SRERRLYVVAGVALGHHAVMVSPSEDTMLSWCRLPGTPCCHGVPLPRNPDGRTAMRTDIVPGARFPDYALPDQTGTKRKLSELQGDSPMVVLLSRGIYCPKDRRQAMELVRFEPELKVGYAKLVTISTDDLLATNENRDGL